MLQRIFSICIAGAFGLLILSILWPQKAQVLAIQILKGVSNLRGAEMPLLGYDEPPIKIVDPEAIPTVISSIPRAVKKDAAVLSNIVIKRFTNVTTKKETVTISIESVIEATNGQRTKEGLPPLATNALLIESAKIKTEDMIANQYFEHTSPAGVTVSDLGDRVGYDYIVMGENLALGNFDDAADLLTAWMNSPGHRANILNPQYKEIGVYAMRGTYQGHSVWFAVQHFGTNRLVCPTISTEKKKEIDSINRQLQRSQAEISLLRNKIEERSTADGEAYQQMVNEFNKMVDVYNTLLAQSRDKIYTYNKTVSNFNQCLSKYQTNTAE